MLSQWSVYRLALYTGLHWSYIYLLAKTHLPRSLLATQISYAITYNVCNIYIFAIWNSLVSFLFHGLQSLPRFAGLPRILRVNRQRRPCNLCHCARHVIHVIPVTCITWPLVNITPRSHVIVRVAWRHCKKSAVKMAEIVRPSWRFCFAKAPRAARA